MSTRTKTLGVAAAITAALVAVPTAVQAYAEPTPTTPTTTGVRDSDDNRVWDHHNQPVGRPDHD